MSVGAPRVVTSEEVHTTTHHLTSPDDQALDRVEFCSWLGIGKRHHRQNAAPTGCSIHGKPGSSWSWGKLASVVTFRSYYNAVGARSAKASRQGNGAPDIKKTRIGFVGTVPMGQCVHLWNYIAIEEYEVVALAQLHPELARFVGQRYGIPKVYTRGAQMLAAESLDAIAATHQFQRLGQLMPPLLEHGLPVMTEKPIGRSVEVGAKLAQYQAPVSGCASN